MGSFEGSDHVIRVYAGDVGTRYTVEDRATDEVLLELATRADVEVLLPEVRLPDLADGSMDVSIHTGAAHGH